MNMLYIRFIMSALTIFSLSARGGFGHSFGGSVLGSFTGSVLGNAMTQPRTVNEYHMMITMTCLSEDAVKEKCSMKRIIY